MVRPYRQPARNRVTSRTQTYFTRSNTSAREQQSRPRKPTTTVGRARWRRRAPVAAWPATYLLQAAVGPKSYLANFLRLPVADLHYLVPARDVLQEHPERNEGDVKLLGSPTPSADASAAPWLSMRGANSAPPVRLPSGKTM